MCESKVVFEKWFNEKAENNNLFDWKVKEIAESAFIAGCNFSLNKTKTFIKDSKKIFCPKCNTIKNIANSKKNNKRYYCFKCKHYWNIQQIVNNTK